MLLGLATTTPAFAPLTLAPLAPMLSKTPCLAFTLSEVSQESREDCRDCKGLDRPAVKLAARTSRLLRPNILMVDTVWANYVLSAHHSECVFILRNARCLTVYSIRVSANVKWRRCYRCRPCRYDQRRKTGKAQEIILTHVSHVVEL